MAKRTSYFSHAASGPFLKVKWTWYFHMQPVDLFSWQNGHGIFHVQQSYHTLRTLRQDRRQRVCTGVILEEVRKVLALL